jgi:hypothetical protein
MVLFALYVVNYGDRYFLSDLVHVTEFQHLRLSMILVGLIKMTLLLVGLQLNLSLINFELIDL